MKVEIKNCGPGEVKRLILEASSIPECVDLNIYEVDYKVDPPTKRLLSEVSISADQLKAAMDSLIKVCKKPKR